MSTASLHEPLLPTGVDGLDHILAGGLTPDRLYLVEGDPGAGKTTLALQFLIEGAKRNEPGLYVTLSETRSELLSVARSHGWDMENLTIFELPSQGEFFEGESQYSMFHPSETELTETTKSILAEVERLKPVRIVFDSLSEMRLLAQSPLRYRRQILALKQFFSGRKSTVLLLDESSVDATDVQLQSIAHAVIQLEHLAPEFGAERRRIRIKKYRGSRFRGGFHDFRIIKGGLVIYPRLIATEHRTQFPDHTISSGIPTLDLLLGGGVDRATSTLIMGPAGCGKSSLAIQYACAAADRGDTAAVFTFDESRYTLIKRTRGLGIDIEAHIANSSVTVTQIDPAELSPGEFTSLIQKAVEIDHVKVVVIDSLNGYINAMPEERFLITQLHEILTYLGQKGVTTFLIVAQHGLVSTISHAPVDASYLADSVILLRYFEAEGSVRQAISIVKKRSGTHERTIREYTLGAGGVRVGAPLEHFQGILTGNPSYVGNMGDLMQKNAGGLH